MFTKLKVKADCPRCNRRGQYTVEYSVAGRLVNIVTQVECQYWCFLDNAEVETLRDRIEASLEYEMGTPHRRQA